MKLTADRFQESLSTVGLSLSKDEVLTVYTYLDTDKDGCLNVDEFCQIYTFNTSNNG